MDTLKKFIPPSVINRVRNAFLFRAEDPNNLHQVLPQKITNVNVERIKGYRFPAPGSRTGAKIPRDSEDGLYDTNYIKSDPLNLPDDSEYGISGTKGLKVVSTAPFRGKTHGKRKITLLPYDPSGLRTTKTITWESLDKVLIDNAKPDHLPAPWWEKDIEAIEKERADKGLPAPEGKFLDYRKRATKNMFQAKW